MWEAVPLSPLAASQRSKDGLRKFFQSPVGIAVEREQLPEDK